MKKEEIKLRLDKMEQINDEDSLIIIEFLLKKNIIIWKECTI